jgi:hypothetical protein
MSCRALALALVLMIQTPATLVAQQEQAAGPVRPDSLFPEPPISPGGAFLRSLVIPGWAQAELGAEARGAFYFFAEAFSLFMVARTQIRLDHAERNLPDDDPLVLGRRQQREDWIAMAVFWAFFAAADGWVSVHLYGFDERTGLEPEQVAFGVSFRIPLGP